MKKLIKIMAIFYFLLATAKAAWERPSFNQVEVAELAKNGWVMHTQARSGHIEDIAKNRRGELGSKVHGAEKLLQGQVQGQE